MPYTRLGDLPEGVRKLPEGDQRRWMAIWNSAQAACLKDGGEDCEAVAFRQANGVVMGDDPPDTQPVALFTLNAPTEESGAFLIRRGKLFEAGEYPDKAFSLSPAELAAAVAGFTTPLPVNLSHVPSVLDGKVGELRAVEVGADGRTLLGTVAIPKWLDGLLEDSGRKVSCEWDRVTKRLAGLALVNRPRVPDAALMAAFAESELADFAGRRNSASDQERVQRVHDMATELGAECAPVTMARGARREKPMTMWEKFKAFIEGNPEARAVFDESGDGDGSGGGPVVVTETPRPPVEPAKPPEPARPDPEKVAMQARIAALEAERRLEAAVHFADAQIAVNKAVPAERPAIVAAFVRAAEDDALSPATVLFGEGRSGGRVETLKALYDSRPAHILTAEALPPDLKVEQILAAFTMAKDPSGMSEERKRALLKATPTGRAVLQADTNGRGG